MQLEDYFDFLSPADIRIHGHRIGIESILYEYVHRSQTPEQIAGRYTTLTLEEVYATILYYLRNREVVSDYLARWLEHGERARATQARDPELQQLRERLRKVRAERLTQEATADAVPG
jgi:uncharacterized protein (DUF433 family)